MKKVKALHIIIKAKNYYLLAFEQGHELAMERIDALKVIKTRL